MVAIPQDPIGLAGGNPTLYGHVENTSVQIDPFGLVPKGLFKTDLKLRGFNILMRGKVSMEKIITPTSYGICVFSPNVLLDFLKAEGIKRKKILDYFENNPEHYLKLVSNGIWLPFAPINFGNYEIKMNSHESFSEKWKKNSSSRTLISKSRIICGLLQ